MKAMGSTLILCMHLAGCTAAHPDTVLLEQIRAENARVEELAQPVRASEWCPPLPQLPPQSDRAARHLFTFILIELYKQCAESKK